MVIKSTVIHAAEALGVLALSFGLDTFVNQIAPSLPQSATLATLVVALSAVAKYLRANPKITMVKDYVNGQ